MIGGTKFVLLIFIKPEENTGQTATKVLQKLRSSAQPHRWAAPCKTDLPENTEIN